MHALTANQATSHLGQLGQVQRAFAVTSALFAAVDAYGP